MFARESVRNSKQHYLHERLIAITVLDAAPTWRDRACHLGRSVSAIHLEVVHWPLNSCVSRTFPLESVVPVIIGNIDSCIQEIAPLAHEQVKDPLRNVALGGLLRRHP